MLTKMFACSKEKYTSCRELLNLFGWSRSLTKWDCCVLTFSYREINTNFSIFLLYYFPKNSCFENVFPLLETLAISDTVCIIYGQPAYLSINILITNIKLTSTITQVVHRFKPGNSHILRYNTNTLDALLANLIRDIGVIHIHLHSTLGLMLSAFHKVCCVILHMNSHRLLFGSSTEALHVKWWTISYYLVVYRSAPSQMKNHRLLFGSSIEALHFFLITLMFLYWVVPVWEPHSRFGHVRPTSL